MLLKLHEWHHVAIARRSVGTSLIWVDGKLVLDGRLISPGLPIVDGSQSALLGRTRLRVPFHGVLQDICAFDRILSDGETLALYQHRFQARPALNTDARRRATMRPAPAQSKIENVSPRPEAWIHKRFTTEDNLPANNVKAVLQAKSGYLWVGTEQACPVRWTALS